MSKENSLKKSRRYRFSSTDDLTHETLWTFRVSRSGLFILIISALLVILAISFSLIAFTPAKTFIPGYPDAHAKREAIQNAIRIDSLENVISRWDLYSENLKRILKGEEEPVKIDSIIARNARKEAKEAKEYSTVDSILRKKVLQEEQFEISGKVSRNTTIEGMHFFPPLKGTLLKPYDELLHPYVDIAPLGNAVVMAVLDGTVIEDYWSDTYGNVIVIQHENDIVSIYKHNQKAIKKSGDKVSAGNAIGIINKSSSGNEHLHFELWHKGESVDPALYINL